jgi:hypothetical protein
VNQLGVYANPPHTSIGIWRPMRIFRLLALLTLSLTAWPCAAGEFVAVGRVEQITLLPEGSDRCPLACPVDVSGKSVCISNSCGCGEALVRVERSVVGAARPTVLARSRLGEWCESEFPLGEPILIRVADGESLQWSGLQSLDKPGDYGFEAGAFTFLGNVDVRKLKASDGLASLSELEQALTSNDASKVSADAAPPTNR